MRNRAMYTSVRISAWSRLYYDGRSITPRTELGIFRNLVSEAICRRYVTAENA